VVITDNGRRVRADAARNAERILRVARATFADLGPEAPLDEVARRADVGIRTLFNHFPKKEDLVRAALEQSISENLTPAIERSLADKDPMRGLLALVEAAMELAAHERNTLAAARGAGILSAEFYPVFEDSLALLAERAQGAGRLRADLTADDLPRLMGMLVSTLWTMAPATGGWRRYVALMFEGLSPVAAKPLPPAVARVSLPGADHVGL
jgi:AcrR family transcriptional regulator